MIGVSERSFEDWKNRFPSLSSALKQGKAPVDIEIEDSMATLAKGHYVTVKKPIKIRTEKRLKKKDTDGKEYETGTIIEEHVEYMEEQIYIPPNVTAQIFWLKNRKPDQWKDARTIESKSDGQLAALIDGLKEPANSSILTDKEGTDDNKG